MIKPKINIFIKGFITVAAAVLFPLYAHAGLFDGVGDFFGGIADGIGDAVGGATDFLGDVWGGVSGFVGRRCDEDVDGERRLEGENELA